MFENAERVASRLVGSGTMGTVVVLKLKFADFTVHTRRRKLPATAWDTSTLYETCRALLREWTLPVPLRVRLVGVSVTDLSEEAGDAPVLFPDRTREKRKALEELLVHAKEKRGLSVTRADLLPREKG